MRTYIVCTYAHTVLNVSADGGFVVSSWTVQGCVPVSDRYFSQRTGFIVSRYKHQRFKTLLYFDVHAAVSMMWNLATTLMILSLHLGVSEASGHCRICGCSITENFNTKETNFVMYIFIC